MTLNWQTINIPFGTGLDSKTDPRAVQAPSLVRADNIQFDEVGNVSKRLPYAALPIVDSSGSTITDLRRLATADGELVLFAKDAAYSYSPATSSWHSRSVYLAAAIAEESVFARPSDQTQCERAELGGIVVYAWVDEGATDYVWLAALDGTSGATVLAPTRQTGTASAATTRPRLVVLDSCILLFAADGTNLAAKRLDIADLATGAGSAWTTVSSALSLYYDVIPNGAGTSALVVWRQNPTTSYGHADVDADLVVTAGTKARNCSGPIAVALSPEDHLAIVRVDATAIEGDILSSTFIDTGDIDIAMGSAAGTPINQLAAAFHPTAVGGEYDCHAWWSAEESIVAATEFMTETAQIRTDGTVTSETTFVRRCGVVSTAFAHDGHLYLWLAFAQRNDGADAQLQSTYFLYREDGVLVAKAAAAIAGGHSTLTGHLATTQALGSNRFGCALIERRKIHVGTQLQDYSARTPRDVVVTFDADEARRCVQLGRTLYVTGGQLRGYDGNAFHEIGFPIFPYALAVADSGVAGNLAAGTYTWLSSLAWPNARGEVDRSTTATYVEATIAANRKATVTLYYIPVSSKDNGAGPAIQVWRSTVNPSLEAPYYLDSGTDPAVTTGDNAYLENETSVATVVTLTDNFADSVIMERETFPETGGILEALAPPAANIIASNGSRIFLAGVPGHPNEVYYSKYFVDGEVVAFNDLLRFSLPPPGEITALGFLNGTLLVFTSTAVHAVAGEGFDNVGGGGNYGPARILSGDVGAENAESIAQVPQGLLFKSAKGWYLIDQGFSARYVGAPVAAYDSETVLAIDVLESQHQVRALTASRMLVWDYLAGQWSPWTISGARHSVMHDGAHHYVTSSGVFAQDAAWGSTEADYALDVELAPIRGELIGYQKVRRIQILGEYRSDHGLRVRLARDNSSSYFDDTTKSFTGLTAGDTEELRHGPSISKSRALSVRITDTDPGGAVSWGESVKLTGIALEVGIKAGIHKNLAAANKQ